MKTTRNARTPRFYHEGKIEAYSELELSKKASHHLVTVVRTKIDDKIELFNGDGNNYSAIVTDVGKRARLRIEDCIEATNESPVSITLVQAISRGERMDLTVRQAVELGVSQIQPLYCRHSVKALDEKRTAKKMEHWQNIIISACEQSGRARVPLLEEPITLNQWLEQTEHTSTTSDSHSKLHTCKLILAPTAEHTFSNLFHSMQGTLEKCSLLIGPESGFDEDEIHVAVCSGVQSVSFGRRILRTETAGPATIAVVQSLVGDLG